MENLPLEKDEENNFNKTGNVYEKKFNHFVLTIILILISDSFAQNSNSTAAPAPDFPPSYYDVVALFLIAIIITGFIAIVYYEGRKEVVRIKKQYRHLQDLDNI
jgi:hypothetical protein